MFSICSFLRRLLANISLWLNLFYCRVFGEAMEKKDKLCSWTGRLTIWEHSLGTSAIIKFANGVLLSGEKQCVFFAPVKILKIVLKWTGEKLFSTRHYSWHFRSSNLARWKFLGKMYYRHFCMTNCVYLNVVDNLKWYPPQITWTSGYLKKGQEKLNNQPMYFLWISHWYSLSR